MLLFFSIINIGGRRGRDRKVVRFTNIYAISATNIYKYLCTNVVSSIPALGCVLVNLHM